MGFPHRGAAGLAALVWAWVGGAGRAEAQQVVRLQDVVTVAVRQSPDLARARIDLDAARATLLTAEGRDDVHISASAEASVIDAGNRDPNGSTDQERVSLSASRALPTGGTVSVTASGDHQKLSALREQEGMVPVSVDLFERFSTGLSLGITQPLLRGAGSAFHAPVRQAARQRDAAALLREARARDVVVSLSQAYWQVALAWRQLEVRKASLALAEQQLDQTERAIRAEKVSRSETFAVQQAIASRKQDVLAGEQELYERSLALRQLAGLEIEPDAIAVATEPLPAKVEPAGALDVASSVRAAFERSAELASLEAARHAAEIGVGAADNAARAQLDLGITAGVVGADETAADALENLRDDRSYTVIANLTFDRAIGRRAERGSQDAARAAAARAKLDERAARAQLAVRATRAVQRAQSALTSIGLGDEAIGLAQQNVTAEQTRFQLGKSTNFDVLRRQEELEQARLRHALAITDYLTARAELDGLSGEILGRYGIVMQ